MRGWSRPSVNGNAGGRRDGTRPTVLFVNRFYAPNQSATAQMLTGLAERLADGGRDVRIITSRQERSGSRRETVRGVSVERVANARFARFGLVGRLVDYLTFGFAAGRAVLRQTSPGDIVVAKTDPPLLGVLIGPIARWKGAASVHWLQDLYPEAMDAAGFRSSGLSRLVLDALGRLRDRELKRATSTVVIGNAMRARLNANVAEPPKTILIPNCADGGSIRPQPPREDFASQRPLTIGYCGTLGRMHDAETLLEAVHLTAANGCMASAHVHWRFVGGGVGHQAITDAKRKLHLEHVTCEPPRVSAAVSDMLAEMDLHIVSLKPAAEGVSLPSKLYGILAAGRPVVFIGAANSEIAQLVRRHDIGIAVTNGEPERLVRALAAYGEDRERLVSQGRNARAVFERMYDRPIIAAQWDGLLGALAAEHRASENEMAATSVGDPLAHSPGALASSASRIARRY